MKNGSRYPSPPGEGTCSENTAGGIFKPGQMPEKNWTCDRATPQANTLKQTINIRHALDTSSLTCDMANQIKPTASSTSRTKVDIALVMCSLYASYANDVLCDAKGHKHTPEGGNKQTYEPKHPQWAWPWPLGSSSVRSRSGRMAAAAQQPCKATGHSQEKSVTHGCGSKSRTPIWRFHLSTKFDIP